MNRDTALLIAIGIASFCIGWFVKPSNNYVNVDTGLEERLLRDAENARKRADSLLVMDARKNEQIRQLELELIKNEKFIDTATPDQLDSLFTVYLR